MKKYVLTIVFACLVAANVSAQAIYKEVVAMKANVEKLMNDIEQSPWLSLTEHADTKGGLFQERCPLLSH